MLQSFSVSDTHWETTTNSLWYQPQSCVCLFMTVKRLRNAADNTRLEELALQKQGVCHFTLDVLPR